MSSTTSTPDFRARARAKQAWLVRRSEPGRGLLLGLVGATAIGCLGAFAVLSFIPSEIPVPTVAGTPENLRPAKTSTRSETTGSPQQVRQVSAARVSTPATSTPAPAAPFTTTPAGAQERASPDISSAAPGTPQTPADPPATRSLTAEPPVLASGEAMTKQKAKKKKVVVERRKRPRPNDWAFEPRHRPPLNEWAYRGNFFRW